MVTIMRHGQPPEHDDAQAGIDGTLRSPGGLGSPPMSAIGQKSVRPLQLHLPSCTVHCIFGGARPPLN